MTTKHAQCTGPLSTYAGELAQWLSLKAVRPERSKRTIATFYRFSAWMATEGVGPTGLNEDLVDSYVTAEQSRSGSATPAAFQYTPLIKKFLAERHGMVRRGPRPRDLGGIPRLRKGPLTPRIPTLVAWLTAQGYTRGTRDSVACTLARLSAWMGRRQLGLDALDNGLLAQFVASQARGRDRHPSSARRIVTARKALIDAGLLTAPVPLAAPPEPASPAQELLYLWGQDLHEQGLCPSTIGEYQRWVDELVTSLASTGAIEWGRLTGPVVNRYVAQRGTGFAMASRRHLVTAIRAFLMWAWRTGRLDRPMAAMVLTPRRPSTVLPRALRPDQLRELLAAADTYTPAGLRDRAIVVLISRLGLRAGEVARLSLDDLDWHHSRLTVCGKGGRTLTLPIPVDVGDALVDYLRDERPSNGADRAVFLRTRPPIVGLTGKGISSAVAGLAARAGLGVVHAHRLRHTAATSVLAGGGSLIEARELLGHARTDTTRIYAKTDLTSLAALLTPWGHLPGKAS